MQSKGQEIRAEPKLPYEALNPTAFIIVPGTFLLLLCSPATPALLTVSYTFHFFEGEVF